MMVAPMERKKQNMNHLIIQPTADRDGKNTIVAINQQINEPAGGANRKLNPMETDRWADGDL